MSDLKALQIERLSKTRDDLSKFSVHKTESPEFISLGLASLAP